MNQVGDASIYVMIHAYAMLKMVEKFSDLSCSKLDKKAWEAKEISNVEHSIETIFLYFLQNAFFSTLEM